MMDMTMECFPAGDKPAVFLWRFMIGGPWQKKGYAREVMDLLREKYRSEDYEYLYILLYGIVWSLWLLYEVWIY